MQHMVVAFEQGGAVYLDAGAFLTCPAANGPTLNFEANRAMVSDAPLSNLIQWMLNSFRYRKC